METDTPTPPVLYDRLVDDRAEWDLSQVAGELDMQDQTVRIWFRNALKGHEVPTPAAARPASSRQVIRNWVRAAKAKPKLIAALRQDPPRPDCLPPPERSDGIRVFWAAGVIRRWAMQTGRMTFTGEPVRRKAPGRAVPEAALQVAQVPLPARELIEDVTEWDMPLIAAALGVSKDTVKTWRYNQLQAARKGNTTPTTVTFPTPVRISFGKPLWHAGTVRLWAMQTGRMTFAGQSCRPKSPGRPRAA